MFFGEFKPLNLHLGSPWVESWVTEVELMIQLAPPILVNKIINEINCPPQNQRLIIPRALVLTWYLMLAKDAGQC